MTGCETAEFCIMEGCGIQLTSEPWGPRGWRSTLLILSWTFLVGSSFPEEGAAGVKHQSRKLSCRALNEGSFARGIEDGLALVTAPLLLSQPSASGLAKGLTGSAKSDITCKQQPYSAADVQSCHQECSFHMHIGADLSRRAWERHGIIDLQLVSLCHRGCSVLPAARSSVRSQSAFY